MKKRLKLTNSCQSNRKLVQEHMQKTSGKVVTMKDIHNVKRSTPSTDSSLLMDLLHEMKKVPGACVEIVKDDEFDIVRGIYFQDGIMRHIFEKYPELLFIDATYKLNNLRLPLFVLMAVDGDGASEIICFWIVSDESASTLQSMLKIFKNFNPKWDEINCIMADKDMTERQTLKTEIPNASLRICFFHVLRSFKREVTCEKLKISLDQRFQALEILQKLAYARSPEAYDQLYEELRESNMPSVLQYFNTNWHCIKVEWVDAFNSMVDVAVATDCQLNIDSIKLTKDIPYKIFDENVNIERIKKYFTKDAWKYLKDLLREKKESECWVANMSVTEQDSIITTNYQVEVDEWTHTNRELKHHGLPVVKLLHPSDVTLLSGRTVCLEGTMSKTLRQNLTSLMADCDHRQTLIQDLIVQNNKLKKDLSHQAGLTEKYHGRMKELQILLESSRSRVQELEEDSQSFISHEEEKLLNTKRAMHAKCKQLEQKNEEQELEVQRLKVKLQKMADEEDKRSSRQSQVFQEFKKRTAKAHSAMDDKLLDVIDSYEREIQALTKELEFYKQAELGESPTLEDSRLSTTHVGMSSNMKSLIKSYEKQLKKAGERIKTLEDDVELTKLNMGSRPEVKDYRVAQLRIKKLEKLLALHSISVPGEVAKIDPYKMKRKYSTKLEDLDYLPLDLCRHYLRDISKELDVDDIEQAMESLKKITEELDTAQRYEQFCRCVKDLCGDEGDVKGRSLSPSRKKSSLTEKSLQNTVAKLQGWKEDQDSLQELQISVNKLAQRVAPWLKIHLSGEATLERIIGAVDKLVYDDGIVKEKDGKEHPSRTVLENIVKHFQTLFDVPNVSGVFPRMNDIYTKLGEVHNVLNTLRHILGLEPDAKSSEIIEGVGSLCQTHSTTTSSQLRALLQTEDLEGVIRRLEEHNDFFPAFKEIMAKLFEILDLQRMDQVIPAVRALKLLAS
ncbi:hypothetical protein FSP39_007585 [Pinctada imbricata]|uniref:Centrosomal protein of 70 kDa n=1 Tax=Pinctada imbricata TaxID=66713 RepID=A0AA88YJ19_PINIB|nr:hypothetical protein FSP39_007585 [Pinctada imbricata]